MKLKQLMMLGLTTVIFLGGTTAVVKNSSTASEPSNFLTLAQASGQVLSQGRFVTVDRSHTTIGNVRLIEENGVRYLELADNFQTVSGPQVEVILHRQKQVGRKVRERDYVTVASLQKIRGTQRYLLPASVEISDFGAVAIWCRRFNITFGYAQI